jgi:sulfotransferase
MKKYEQFVCLSGLPRSGSTLLSAILSQNPKIHAEGNSAVCQLMWDTQHSCLNRCNEQLNANNRKRTIKELLKSIPAVYYNDIDENEKIIVDKCRSWTVIDNINLLKENIDKNIKIIMLERPILEIINSFHRLFIKNYRLNDLNMLLVPDSEPVMRPLNGLIYAKQNNKSNNFLFITYKELTENTEETIKKIYDFCNWEYFEHDFNNIVPKYAENDEEYGLEGFHYVYPSIRNVKNEIILPEDIKEKCIDFDDILNNVNFLYKN